MSTTDEKCEPLFPIEPDRLYDYAAAAQLFGVTDRKIRGWIEARKIGFVELPGGRGRRISGRQILDSIAANTVDPEVG